MVDGTVDLFDRPEREGDPKLDYELGKALGLRVEIEEDGVCWEHVPPTTTGYGGHRILAREFRPTSEWYTLGPLIEHYGISISRKDEEWVANTVTNRISTSFSDKCLFKAITKLSIVIAKRGR